MDTTAPTAAGIVRASAQSAATRISAGHATHSVLVDLVAHLVIAFAIGLAASLALAGAVLMLSEDAPVPQANSYAVPATPGSR